MAIVSESMLYQERIAPSYVSSSSYYGYVPPTCPFVNYESVVVKQPCNSANEATNGTTNNIAAAATASSVTNPHWTVSSDTIFQNHNNHNDDTIRKFGSAMETDEDETLRSDESRIGVSRCQNNRCVIPEAGVQRVNTGSPSHGRYQGLYRYIEESEVNAMSKRRGNLKRNSAGDPAYLIDDRSANRTKKFRQGSTRKSGSSTLHYEQTPLIDVDNIENETRESFTESKDTRCQERAGNNYDSFDRTNNHERSFTLTKLCKDSKFGDTYLDYEIMLMETHGCSSYHYNPYRNSYNAVSPETEL